MKYTYTITGFPGFLANHLIHDLVTRQYVSKLYLLVLPSMKSKAEKMIERITTNHAIDYEIIETDITEPSLNWNPSEFEKVSHDTTHLIHLAAIYDLAVSYELANNVNVNGTHHINQFAKSCPNLEHYVYYSTAFVSGDREGIVYESEISQPTTFKNHYEQTKYEAELLVEEIKNHVPTTIIRPGIVIGDSKNGETDKFDGPYFILNTLNSLQHAPILPYIGQHEARANFVPIDYIVAASIHLLHSETAINKTFHLTDPRPYQAQTVYSMFTYHYLNRQLVGQMPYSFARFTLRFSFIRKWLGIEQEALDYFICNVYHDCSETLNELKGTGIICPDLASYLPQIINYYKKHQYDQTKHVLIK
ncbi:SDR family oxidoreductase [Alkalibacillus almallahensis]|uniref:SDR family oxidoreductase n=1 Tax=Alkalibacillus almallahensis TaxID=1379154 RepID=UPI00141F6FFB|nr:SDR family oxidoreductase [Alkalibacillus almallahensis]NIK13378.1 thioester reductase-like protein [Alkalibacillus almallahensis]